jgi:fucose permease
MKFLNAIEPVQSQAKVEQIQKQSFGFYIILLAVILILICFLLVKEQKNEELKDNLSQAKSSEKSLKAEIIRLQKQVENKKDEKA